MITFKQFLLELEITVPPTSYGYWIECQPDGQAIIHPVNREEGHKSFVRSYNDAFLRGWIRGVIGPGEANFEWMQDRPSRMAYEAMIAIVEHYGTISEQRYGQFYVQFDAFNPKTGRKISKQTQNVEQAIAFIRQTRKQATSVKDITEQFAYIFQEKILDFPDSRQGTNFTCGAAAVQSVLRYYSEQDDQKENEISKELKTTTSVGAQPENIVKFFKKRGYTVDSRKMTIDDVKKYIDKKVPVIMLIQAWGDKKDYTSEYKDGHYVVAIGYQDDIMYFDDPSIHSNRGELSFAEVKRRWHGQKSDPVNLGIAISGKKSKYKSSEIIKIK